MREIKFRGKRPDESFWRYGDLDTTGVGVVRIKNRSEVFRVEERSVGQFAGLKDKNGFEIYEGDILIDRHEEETGEVVFEDGAFFWETETFTQLLGERNDEIEVIGNIWEDGELIK